MCGGGKKPRKPKIKKQLEGNLVRDVKNLFEQADFFNNICVEYKSNGDRNKTLLTIEHLDKIKLYLKDIINNLKKSDTWKL